MKNWLSKGTSRLPARCLRPVAARERRPGARRASAARHPDQPSRPRLRGRAVLQHGLGHRPRRQQAARRDQARRSAARQFQPALQGPGAGPRHGLFAGSPHAGGGLDRIEFGDLHRYRHQRRQAHRPMSAARRMRRSSRPTARRSGSRCAARTTSPCSTPRPSRRRRASSRRAGPGMQIFSPDGKYGYICSSFNPETDVVSVADHKIVAKVKQESPFCPNIAATPDGQQVWFTLKDIGKTQVFNAKPPFNLIKTIDTGPITNHVNFAHTAKGTFAYVTVGGTERGQGVPHRRLLAGRDHPGRQSAAWRLAVGRRHARLCRA